MYCRCSALRLLAAAHVLLAKGGVCAGHGAPFRGFSLNTSRVADFGGRLARALPRSRVEHGAGLPVLSRWITRGFAVTQVNPHWVCLRPVQWSARFRSGGAARDFFWVCGLWMGRSSQELAGVCEMSTA